MKFKNIHQIIKKYANAEDGFYLARFEATVANNKPIKIKPVKIVTIEQEDVSGEYFSRNPYINLIDQYGNVLEHWKCFDFSKYIVGDTLDEVEKQYKKAKVTWAKKRMEHLEKVHKEEMLSLKKQINHAKYVTGNEVLIEGNNQYENDAISRLLKRSFT